MHPYPDGYCLFPPGTTLLWVNGLIANILFEPLCALSPIFKSLLKPNARLVLSGILNHQATDLKKIYPFIEWDALKFDGEWVLISGTHKPSS